MLAKVFESLKFILERLVGPRTRREELRDLRCRLKAQAGPSVASQAEVKLALRLRVLREELAARVGEVKACGRCVQPRSVSWPGGHCCSGRTRNLFTDHELLALRLSGTKSAHLKPPRSEHAGCAFRGPHGCSLDTAHRPSLCVRYMCRELQSEIEQRSDAPAIAHLQEKLRVGVERFEGLVKERTLARDDELCRRTMLHLRRNR